VSACPKCASKRLRRAPLPVISAIVALFSKRRRYACPNCQWSGWKRRMRRSEHIEGPNSSMGPA